MGETMKKLTTYTALLASVIYLSGCGGGGSDNAATPPKGTRTTISIGNISSQTYARAVLLNQDGTVFQEREFECQPGASECKIFLQSELNQPVTLIVLDANRRMIRAFQYPNAPSAYKTTYPSNLSTGLYLTERLVHDFLAKENISWEQANLRLATFFQNYDSPDGSGDFFEEVGDLYEKEITSSGMGEGEFLESLKQRLMNWDVAAISELPITTLSNATSAQKFTSLFHKVFSATYPIGMSKAYAQEAAQCAPGLQTFLSVVANLGEMIPIAGDFVSGAAGIGADACDGTDKRLDQIESKLDTLQKTVDTVATNLNVLKEFSENAALNTQTSEFQKLVNSSIDIKEKYRNFLQNNGDFKSLEEYFESKKGWVNGLKIGDAELEKILSAPGTQVPDLTRFASYQTFDTYLEALNGKCKAVAQNSQKNWIAVRQYCNTLILSNTAMMVGAQSNLLPMFKDIYNVLEKYNKAPDTMGMPYNKFGYPSGVKSYGAAGLNDIKTMFVNQQAALIDKFKSNIGKDKVGLFNAFDGLDEGLRQNLSKVMCNQLDKGRSASPNIIGWYTPTVNVNDNYIVTSCRVMDGVGAQIVSKYYYQSVVNKGGYTPVNMMGVPIASGYLDSGGYSAETTEEKPTYSGGFYSVMPMSDVHFANPESFAISVNKFRRHYKSGVVQPYLPSHNDSEGYTNWQPSQITLKPGRILVQLSTPEGTSSENFIRYTDKNNFSYIWKHRVKDNYNSKSHYMRCLSGGCAVTDNNHRLSFKDGPQSIWFFKFYKSPYYYVYEIDGMDKD